MTPLTTCIAALHTVNVNIASSNSHGESSDKTDRMFVHWKRNIICLESRGKEDVIPLAECVAEVRNHLKSCDLSRTKVTEHELILARVGKFNLPLDEIKKLTICPKHRHDLAQYWRPLKTCQYPNHEGRKIALHCKNPVSWEMAQEIQTMFITLVQVGFA